MILVDTSVWADHIRRVDEFLSRLLNSGRVLGHPFVTGELALGSLRQRDRVLETLEDLPQATVAANNEVLQFINQHKLYGLGIGYIDVHLLAAVKLTVGSTLWTRDKRLHEIARQLHLAMAVAG